MPSTKNEKYSTKSAKSVDIFTRKVLLLLCACHFFPFFFFQLMLLFLFIRSWLCRCFSATYVHQWIYIKLNAQLQFCIKILWCLLLCDVYVYVGFHIFQFVFLPFSFSFIILNAHSAYNIFTFLFCEWQKFNRYARASNEKKNIETKTNIYPKRTPFA